MRITTLMSGAFLLLACETGPSIEEIQAADRAACDSIGFTTDSDAFKLCMLLKDTNRRLDAMERRISFMELDLRGPYSRYGSCGYRRC